MSEKTILDEIAEWFHNWWHGQPEQTQHEGTSSADESGETTEVAEAGGTDETLQARETEEFTGALSGPPTDRTLPRDKGTFEVS